MMKWGDLFAPRQALALSTLCRLVGDAGKRVAAEHPDGFAEAVQTCLAMAIDRQADFQSSLVTWTAGGEFLGHTFTRQAIPMVWDFAEGNPWAEASGNWSGAVNWVCGVIEASAFSSAIGHPEAASASAHPLPNDAVHALITDPPYYDAVPYAHLSDYFYVWLRRSVGSLHKTLLQDEQVPKDAEIVVDRPHELSSSTKDITFYERELTKAFSEGRRVLRPDGVGLIVFASKTTASWEAILQAVVDAGWTMTGSWPIDTEREARIAAQGQARLASSVHLVCRPREREDGQLIDSIGDWRDILAELPKRIHDWMPRLASEGIVGADAIFSCLGPALEIFSRYSRVEKASGEQVQLNEYLEHVWAAVAKEALSMIFAGADATGFDPDARLTAMWFWTLSRKDDGAPTKDESADGSEGDGYDDEEGGSRKGGTSSGFVLEYDAARKIAQGLGAHLEQLATVVEVKSDKARLVPVSERAKHLFGKDETNGQRKPAKRGKKSKQPGLFDELGEHVSEPGISATGGDFGTIQAGATVLDRLHQSMILFAAGRSEALKRFLGEEGVGKDSRFWRLAQALSALYPAGTEEKRWVDGVLGRKKGLGF
jgi:hypothetical protein